MPENLDEKSLLSICTKATDIEGQCKCLCLQGEFASKACSTHCTRDTWHVEEGRDAQQISQKSQVAGKASIFH